MKKNYVAILFSLIPLLLNADTLLLNFGATIDNSNTNTPGNTFGNVNGTSWNLITGDTGATVLIDENGDDLTGVSLDMGKSAGTGTLLNWEGTGFSNSSLGGNYSSGIYAGNPKSATFVNDGSTSGVELGIRIKGLAAGQYTAYVVGRNTSTADSDGFRLYQDTVTTVSGDTNYGGFVNADISNASNSSWVQGETFQSFTFTLGGGEDWVLVSEGTAGDNLRGFFNTVEIVAVPEPSSLLLVGLGIAGICSILRRSRRS